MNNYFCGKIEKVPQFYNTGLLFKHIHQKI